MGLGKILSILPLLGIVGYSWIIVELFNRLIQAMQGGEIIAYGIVFLLSIILGFLVYPILIAIFLLILAKG